ncbi:MAG: hypothetical protein CMG85_17980 [Marinobacter sp.]|nr:hypothetical protein [Marinobacter sp.]
MILILAQVVTQPIFLVQIDQLQIQPRSMQLPILFYNFKKLNRRKFNYIHRVTAILTVEILGLASQILHQMMVGGRL